MSRPFQIDQRRYVRYEILDYALCYPEHGEESMNAVITDIGLGGVQVRTKYPVPGGSMWSLHVGREEEAPLILRAEARHCQPVPDSDLYATGFRFMPNNHQERVMIAEYVHGVFQRQCDLMAL